MAVAARAIHIIQRVIRERRNITQETGAARTLLDGRALTGRKTARGR